jgi:hypothetical protein
VLAAFACAEDVVAGVPLSKGAVKIFDLLHELAVKISKVRGYTARPHTVTFHLPASLVALGVGYTSRHLRRLLPELEEAGLIACGAHASKVRDMSLWDGYLWAIKVSPGEYQPRIRREEWKHQWRDFAGDIDAGRTVKALVEQMSALHPEEVGKAIETALEQWSVNPENLSSLVVCSTDIFGQADIKAVPDVKNLAYRLSELAHLHSDKRSEAVGRLASALAQAMNDPHSRRWYCSLLWIALREEWEGRAGLSILASALIRVQVDQNEYSGLRNPAALLNSRLKN